MVIFQNANVSLEYKKDIRLLIQKWTGFATSEVFRAAIDKTLEFVKDNPVETILNNTLEQAVVKAEDAKYAADIMPHLFKNGIKAMAIIMPQSALTQMSLKRFEIDTEGANVKLFAEVPLALNWLNKAYSHINFSF